jgi:hypothetical protein
LSGGSKKFVGGVVAFVNRIVLRLYLIESPGMNVVAMVLFEMRYRPRRARATKDILFVVPS